MKFLKLVAITLVAAFLVVFIGSTIAIGERTVAYMNRQNFDFQTALQWAKDDFDEWMNSIWGDNKESTILEFEFCNKHISVEACTSH